MFNKIELVNLCFSFSYFDVKIQRAKAIFIIFKSKKNWKKNLPIHLKLVKFPYKLDFILFFFSKRKLFYCTTLKLLDRVSISIEFQYITIEAQHHFFSWVLVPSRYWITLKALLNFDIDVWAETIFSPFFYPSQPTTVLTVMVPFWRL